MGLPLRTAGEPEVFNLTLTDANTEYGFELSVNTKKFTFQARTAVDVKFSFAEGTSGSEYFTLKTGAGYFDDNVHAPITIYFQSASAGTVVEIITWISKL